MTRVELKNQAKEQISGKIGLLFVIILIVAGIGVVCSLIPVIGWIGTLVVTPAFEISLCMIYLKLTKNEDISIADTFNGFNITGKALWLYIMTNVFVFLWSLLLVIPGIIKSFAYSMAPYILAENPELTASEALNKSKEMMNGHKLDLFVLQLSFFWWYLLGSITFGIAYIYVLPYVSATIANFYNSIKNKED